MRKSLMTVLLWAAMVGSASAQVAIPNTFVTQTRIQSALVNENFSELGAKACNRTGCTMTGTLDSLTVQPVATDTYALGAAGARYSNTFSVLGNFSGLITGAAGANLTGTLAVTGNATISTTLAVTGAQTFTGATTLNGAVDIAAGLTAGSGNVAIIDATGKVPAVSSTYFASLDGTNLTGVAKLASTNTFTARNDLLTYTETRTTPAIGGGALTLDLALGTHFSVALNAAATITISNPPVSGSVGSFVLQFTADGTPRVITWPASVVWQGGSTPVLTSTNNKRDFFTFITYDGGTTWFGFIAGQNF